MHRPFWSYTKRCWVYINLVHLFICESFLVLMYAWIPAPSWIFTETIMLAACSIWHAHQLWHKFLTYEVSFSRWGIFSLILDVVYLQDPPLKEFKAISILEVEHSKPEETQRLPEMTQWWTPPKAMGGKRVKKDLTVCEALGLLMPSEGTSELCFLGSPRDHHPVCPPTHCSPPVASLDLLELRKGKVDHSMDWLNTTHCRLACMVSPLAFY